MNKTKIVMGSLVAGLISGFIVVSSNTFAGFFLAGILFGVAVVICLKTFFNYKNLTPGRLSLFVFLSGVACLVAIFAYLGIGSRFDILSLALAGAGFLGSMILIKAYFLLLKINISFLQNALLIALGSILSLIVVVKINNTVSNEVLLPYIFVFWQPIMLAAMMYVTIQAEKKQVITSEIKNSPILPK